MSFIENVRNRVKTKTTSTFYSSLSIPFKLNSKNPVFLNQSFIKSHYQCLNLSVFHLKYFQNTLWQLNPSKTKCLCEIPDFFQYYFLILNIKIPPKIKQTFKIRYFSVYKMVHLHFGCFISSSHCFCGLGMADLQLLKGPYFRRKLPLWLLLTLAAVTWLFTPKFEHF